MDGLVLNLIGPLHGKFKQHPNARYVVSWLGGHFVSRVSYQTCNLIAEQQHVGKINLLAPKRHVTIDAMCQ